MEIIRKIYKEEAKDFFFKNYLKGEKINISKTADALNVTRPTIYKWMSEINNS